MRSIHFLEPDEHIGLSDWHKADIVLRRLRDGRYFVSKSKVSEPMEVIADLNGFLVEALDTLGL